MIYLPVTVENIDKLQLLIVDQDGDLVNFRGEVSNCEITRQNSLEKDIIFKTGSGYK